MRIAPVYTAWKITCRSDDDAHAIKTRLANLIELDRVLTETRRVAPGGVEQVQGVRHNQRLLRVNTHFARYTGQPRCLPLGVRKATRCGTVLERLDGEYAARDQGDAGSRVDRLRKDRVRTE